MAVISGPHDDAGVASEKLENRSKPEPRTPVDICSKNASKPATSCHFLGTPRVTSWRQGAVGKSFGEKQIGTEEGRSWALKKPFGMGRGKLALRWQANVHYLTASGSRQTCVAS
jgi:hypothetical protein